MIVILRVIMSWIAPDDSNVIWRILYQITEPFLSPLRRIVPTIGMLDLSPWVAVVVFQLIATLLSFL